MDKRLLIILVCLLQLQVGAVVSHRYRMLLDVTGGCTNEVVFVTVTNEVNERLVKRADVDIFLLNKKVFYTETNDTGVAFFTPTKAGSYLIQVDRSGYLRAETTVDISTCETTSTSTISTTTSSIEITTTIPTTTTLTTSTIQTTTTTPTKSETTLETTIPALIESTPAVETKKGGTWVIVLVMVLTLAVVILITAFVLLKKIKR